MLTLLSAQCLEEVKYFYPLEAQSPNDFVTKGLNIKGGGELVQTRKKEPVD